MKNKMILKDLVNQDLSGWVILEAYSLEADCTIISYHPVVLKGTETCVISLNIYALEEIWKILPKKNVKVSKFLMLYNKESNIGLFVDEISADTETAFIINDIDNQINKYEFEYAYMRCIEHKGNNKNATFPVINNEYFL